MSEELKIYYSDLALTHTMGGHKKIYIRREAKKFLVAIWQSLKEFEVWAKSPAARGKGVCERT